MKIDSRRRDLFIVLVAVGLFMGGLIPLFLILDPLDWHIVDRLSGDFDAAALAVPPDSVAYVSLNLLEVDRDRLQEVVGQFTAAPDIEGGFLAELGLNVEADVVPWIGQYAGVAVVNLQADTFNRTAVYDWVLLLEARRRGRADDFLQKVAAGWATQQGATAVAQRYAGVNLTQFADGLTLGRAGSLVLIGSSQTAVAQAIDAKNDASITQTATYAAAVTSLPSPRFLTLYVNGAKLPQIRDAATVWAAQNMNFVPVDHIQSLSAAGFLVDEGIRLDVATIYDLQALGEVQRQSVTTVTTAQETAVYFPANTLLYLAGQPFNLTWPSFLASGGGDFAESMLLLGQQVGFNPAERLFPVLDGSTAVGLVPGSEGMVRALTGVPLETAVLLGTSQVEQVNGIAADLTAIIRSLPIPLATITDIPVGNATFYQLQTLLGPGIQIVYGLAGNELLLASSADVAQAMRFEGTQSLAETPGYQRALAAFAGQNGPVFYVNVPGLLAAWQSSGEESAAATAVLQPITAVAANANLVDNIILNRIYLFMEERN